MTDRRRTALHEAGHAVAHEVLGITNEYASIRPGKSFHGIAVAVAGTVRDFDTASMWPTLLQPTAFREDVERHVIATLAGGLAAMLLDTDRSLTRRYEDEADEIARSALERLGPRLAELVTSHEREESTGSDEEHARDLASFMADPETVGLYVELLRHEAQTLVLRYRVAILRVADALERRAVLHGAHIAALVTNRADKGDMP